LIVALVLGVIAAAFGWWRAATRGGKITDRMQYAAAHGIPVFLLCMIGMTFAAHMGWLD
jgi:Na+/phosphate symporter